MSPEHERWAEALAVERQHGADAPQFIAERIKVLAMAGDHAGVARWLEIATKLDAITTGPQASN